MARDDAEVGPILVLILVAPFVAGVVAWRVTGTTGPWALLAFIAGFALSIAPPWLLLRFDEEPIEGLIAATACAALLGGLIALRRRTPNRAAISPST